MKYFVATAALVAFASATQQIEHMWRTSPLYHEESGCAADEPEWECIMRPLLEDSTRKVKVVEDEWTADRRKELVDLNIQLEVARKEHKSAAIKAGTAKCSHDREVNMRELYRCELVALRTYTQGEKVVYPGSWTAWLGEQEACVVAYNESVDSCE